MQVRPADPAHLHAHQNFTIVRTGVRKFTVFERICSNFCGCAQEAGFHRALNYQFLRTPRLAANTRVAAHHTEKFGSAKEKRASRRIRVFLYLPRMFHETSWLPLGHRSPSSGPALCENFSSLPHLASPLAFRHMK